jgi:O-antigen ligase
MENVSGVPNRHLLHLAVVWALVIPLFYFAVEGGLWFESSGISGAESISEYGTAFMATAEKGETRAIALLVLAITSFLIASKIKPILMLSRRNGVFIALVILAMASTIWSQFPAKSLINSLYLAVDTLLAFYLYQRFSPEQLLRLLLIVGSICLTLTIILALFFPQYGIDHAASASGWQGVYGHKNNCGEMTVFFLSAALFVPVEGSIPRLARIAYVALSGVVIVMAQSVTSFVAAALIVVFVLVLGLIGKLEKRSRKIAFLVGMAVVLLLTIGGMAYFTEITLLLGKDPTLTGRTEIWSAVLASIAKHPLIGYGYTAFWGGMNGESINVLLSAGWAVQSAHNGLLEIWLTLGALGVGAILYSFARAFKDAVQCVPENRFYCTWYLCILVLMIIYSMGERPLAYPNSLAWILYIVCCVGLSDSAGRIRLLGPENG